MGKPAAPGGLLADLQKLNQPIGVVDKI